MRAHDALSTVNGQSGPPQPFTALIITERFARGPLHVDDNLSIIVQNSIYATGDVACAAFDNEGRFALMTCQHAIPLGKFAGNYATTALPGMAPQSYCHVLRPLECLRRGKQQWTTALSPNQLVQHVAG